MMPATFQVSPLFRETLASKTQSNTALRDKVEQFIRIKTQDPTQQFGSSDKPFRSGGIFSNAVPKIRHAHLTHDLSMVYTVSGGDNPVIRLYGIFSHDDMGTGQPQNLNRQRGIASQFAGQSFGTGEMPSAPAAKTAKPAAKTAGAKPDFTPRTKPVAPTGSNPFVEAVKSADQEWQQRGLLDRMTQAASRNDQLAVINGEIQYLQTIANRNQLYPNQQRYAQKLIQIYNSLTGSKK